MFVGSAYWMAPEQLVDGEKPSKKTDIWSFGTTLYEVMPFASILVPLCFFKFRRALATKLLTGGNMPYSSYETIPQLIAAMMRRSAQIGPVPPSKDWKKLKLEMAECLSWEPSERPTIARLYMCLCYSQDLLTTENRELSMTAKEREVEFYQSRKIRSRAKLDIDIDSAIRGLEDMLKHD